MGFRLIRSPLAHKNPGRLPEQLWHVHVYMLDHEDDMEGSTPALTVFGHDELTARLRAELICMAVNDRPALQEYEAIKSKETT